MMYLYDKQLQFANQIGFKTPAQAIVKVGKWEFLKRFKNEYVELVDDTKKRQYELKERKEAPEGGKEIEGYDGYFIYPDGKMFSVKSQRHVNYYKRTIRNKPYYYYQVSKTTFNVVKIVFFYFGEHSYKKVSEVRNVIQMDRDLENFDIRNLREII